MSLSSHQKKKIKDQLAYLKRIVSNAAEDPKSVDRPPQTIDNWIRILSKELETLIYMMNL